MKIPCVRCGKEIDSPNADNAKYIMNPSDSRTFGTNTVEKVVIAPLTKDRVIEIMTYDLGYIPTKEEIKESEPLFTEGDIDNYINQLYESKLSDFSKLAEVFPDSEGRREVVVEEEVSVPKTAIICKGCEEVGDTVIW